MKEKFRPYNRIGFFHPCTLHAIASDSFNNCLELDKNIEELKNKGTVEIDNMTFFIEQEAIDKLDKCLLKETIKSIIFLGAFLESYFFDYAASALGQRYTENFIEKIDLISKIVLIPKLVTGKEISRELNYWPGIKELIKWRNKIIHNKTKDAIEFLKNNKDNKSRSLQEEIDLRYIFKLVQSLFDELNKIDPKGMHSYKYAM